METVIIIDSNVWIFAENATADEHKIAAHAVQKAVGGQTVFGINAIIVSEVFHALSRFLGQDEAKSRTLNIIEHPSAEWLAFSLFTVKTAVTLSASRKIRINDALIASQSLEMKARVLTDNVKDFKKVKGLKLIKLR